MVVSGSSVPTDQHTRETIIEAAKRAAENAGADVLSRDDFQRITGIGQHHVYRLSPAGHDPAAPGEQQDGAEHDLNEVGSRIWELCDGAHSVEEIAHAIVGEFDIDEETARHDAAEFVQGLLAQGLLCVP